MKTIIKYEDLKLIYIKSGMTGSSFEFAVSSEDNIRSVKCTLFCGYPMIFHENSYYMIRSFDIEMNGLVDCEVEDLGNEVDYTCMDYTCGLLVDSIANRENIDGFQKSIDNLKNAFSVLSVAANEFLGEISKRN